MQQLHASRQGPIAIYDFGVPSTFPSDVTVRNEHGVVLPSARGRRGNFLIVIDPTAGPDDGEPSGVPMAFDVVDPTGVTLQRIVFEGFGSSEFASIEQYQECVHDAGVDMVIATDGDTIPSRPAIRGALRPALTSKNILSTGRFPQPLWRICTTRRCDQATFDHPLRRRRAACPAERVVAPRDCEALAIGFFLDTLTRNVAQGVRFGYQVGGSTPGIKPAPASRPVKSVYRRSSLIRPSSPRSRRLTPGKATASPLAGQPSASPLCVAWTIHSNATKWSPDEILLIDNARSGIACKYICTCAAMASRPTKRAGSQ